MKQLCWVPQLIHQSGISQLEAQGLEVLHGVQELDAEQKVNVVGAIFRDGIFSRSTMEQLPNLRVIAVHGVGTDGIDIPAATDLGIVVFNTPGVNTRSVAEHTLALIFVLAKKLISAQEAIRRDNYLSGRYGKGRREVAGQKIGIVGFGAIARATARLAALVGMQVSVFSRQSAETIEAEGYRKAASLEALLAESDIVSLHVASVPETHHLINADTLKLMKPTAALINTGRGALVDPVALASALESGQIAAAALDVFEHEPLPGSDPLLKAPNLLVTPHIGGSTLEALTGLSEGVAKGLLQTIANERPGSVVNPDVWESRRV